MGKTATTGHRLLNEIFKCKEHPDRENRVVKKYSNRKYYDSSVHNYLSSQEVFELYGRCLEENVPLKILGKRKTLVDGKEDKIEYDATFETLVEGFKIALSKDPGLALKTISKFFESRKSPGHLKTKNRVSAIEAEDAHLMEPEVVTSAG